MFLFPIRVRRACKIISKTSDPNASCALRSWRSIVPEYATKSCSIRKTTTLVRQSYSSSMFANRVGTCNCGFVKIIVYYNSLTSITYLGTYSPNIKTFLHSAFHFFTQKLHIWFFDVNNNCVYLVHGVHKYLDDGIYEYTNWISDCYTNK